MPTPCPAVSRILRAALAALMLAAFLASAANAMADEAASWTGEWHTLWRRGVMLVSLEQNGDRVTGEVPSLNGRIVGRVEGRLLVGDWLTGDHADRFVLAMGADGTTFTGRYGKNEYLNGSRIDDVERAADRFGEATTPRDTLWTAVTSANAAFDDNDSSALRVLGRHLLYEGGTSDLRESHRRQFALWRLMDMSTFDIDDAPVVAGPDGLARFRIGPVDGTETYEIRFRHDDDGLWKIVVEDEATLAAVERRFLDDLGYESEEQRVADRATSPRATMRNFLLGAHEWSAGGTPERVLSTLDLSFLPPHLHDIEGRIFVDYMRQIVDRAGYVIWQEIPDDPAQPLPYVHYRHPHGSVVIERVRGVDGAPDRWLFSADTLRNAPELLRAMQAMPIGEGLSAPVPFTDFFRLREAIRGVAPALLHREFVLETWQWLALLLGFAVALLAGRAAGALTVTAGRAWRRRAGATAEESGGAATPATGPERELDWPVRVTVAGAIAFTAVTKLGVVDSGLVAISRAVAVVLACGIAFLLFRITGIAGHWFIRKAELTPSHLDDIVAALATGLVKLLLIVFTFFACAEIVGLPYEGVVAGLGIGGLALAFAARETVSNMLGAAILLADRPFRRGELIETGGQRATVEAVGLRSTRLRTADDSLLIIPNAQLSDKLIVNWGRRRRRRFQLDVALASDTPRDRIDRFVERLSDVYDARPEAVAGECVAGLKAIGPASIDVAFSGYLDVPGGKEESRARHAMLGDIVDLARETGVAFADPGRAFREVQEAGGRAGD